MRMKNKVANGNKNAEIAAIARYKVLNCNKAKRSTSIHLELEIK